MSTDNERTEDYAEGIAVEVRELEAALTAAFAYAEDGEGDAPTFDGEQWTDPGELLSYYLDVLALEVLDITARSWASSDVHGYLLYVEVLRTFGGPNVRIRIYEGGDVTVRAFWGSSEATRNAYAPTFAAEVWGHAEANAAAYS
jgi:hypothetical protein